MNFRKHLFLIYLSTTWWTWFFLGGLWSGYYRNWPPAKALIILLILPALAFIFLGKSLLKSLTSSHYLRAATIASTYFAAILLLYDFIYLYLYLGKTVSYLTDYWYLTFFTPIPYLVLMPIGLYLDRTVKKPF